MKNPVKNKGYLLAVDIGNTHITCGVFNSKNRLVTRAVTSTHAGSLEFFKRLSLHYPLSRVVICSVVPSALARVKKELSGCAGGCALYIIGKDILVPLVNRYRNPASLGQDRLLAAYAASRLYGAPVVVVDFGTAITFDVVTRKWQYIGGMIFPGLQLCLDALNGRTALLPKKKVRPPKEFIARKTDEGMLSGVVYGVAAMTQALIEKIKEKIGKDAIIVGCGGDSLLMLRYCKQLFRIERDLTLIGISLVFQHSKRGG
jgi:type III pantothenate kinase